jgi:ABC-type multidrug transport system fused ATPase/permease subunit
MLPPVLAERRWQLFLILVVTGVFQSVCFLALVFWAREYIERGVTEFTMRELLVASGLILVLAGGRFIERYQAELIAQKYVYSLRQRVFNHTLMLPVEDTAIVNKGGTLLRLTGDMSAIRNWIVQGMAPLLVIGLLLGFAIAGLFQLDPRLGFSLLLPVCLAIMGNYFLGKVLFGQSERMRRRRGLLIGNVTEKLRELRLIRIFNQSKRESRRFSRQSDRLFDSQIARVRTSALLRGMNEAIVLLSVLLLLVVGLGLVRQGMMSAESVAVVMTAALYLMSQLRRLSRLYEFWTLKQVAEKKLSAFLKRRTIKAKGRTKLSNKPFKFEMQSIECRGRFAPLTAKIGRAERVAVQGGSGTGKSSLLFALAGLINLTGGAIKINRTLISKVDSRLLTRQIALVSSELPLLRGTLRKNLFYGARKVSEDYTEQVLSWLHLDTDKELSLGMNSRVMESGSNLSSGLRYRIMLARALLRRPKLLLLDSEAAMYGEEINHIIKMLLQEFEGAIVINTESSQLAQGMDQIWQLEQSSVQVVSVGNDQAGNVVRMNRHV